MLRVALFLCTFAYLGCSHAPLKRFADIKPGMYKGDVLELVGSPTESRYRGDQYIWVYKFMNENSWVTKEVHVKDDFVSYSGEPVPIASDSKIARVATGMSKSQVLDVMGFPKKTQKRNGKDAWVYASKIGGDAQVQFQEDKVVWVGPAEVKAEEPAPATETAPVDSAGFEAVQ